MSAIVGRTHQSTGRDQENRKKDGASAPGGRGAKGLQAVTGGVAQGQGPSTTATAATGTAATPRGSSSHPSTATATGASLADTPRGGAGRRARRGHGVSDAEAAEAEAYLVREIDGLAPGPVRPGSPAADQGVVAEPEAQGAMEEGWITAEEGLAQFCQKWASEKEVVEGLPEPGRSLAIQYCSEAYQLHTQLVNLQEDANQYRSEFFRIKNEGCGLYKAYNAKSLKLKEISQKYEILRETLIDHEAEVGNLHSVLAEKDQAISELTELCRGRMAMIRELTDAQVATQSALAALKASVRKTAAAEDREREEDAEAGGAARCCEDCGPREAAIKELGSEVAALKKRLAELSAPASPRSPSLLPSPMHHQQQQQHGRPSLNSAEVLLARCESMSISNDLLRKECQNLERALSEARAEREHDTAVIETLRFEAAAARAESAELAASRTAVADPGAILTLTPEEATYQRLYFNAAEEAATLRVRVEELFELAQEVALMDEMQGALQASQGRNASLLAEARGRLEASKIAAAVAVADAEAEVVAARAEVARATAEAAAAKAEAAERAAEYEALRRTKHELQRELSATYAEVEGVMAERVTLRKQVGEIAGDAQVLMTQIGALTAQVAEGQAEREALGGQLRAAEEDRDACRAEAEVRGAELFEARAELASLAESLASVQARLGAAERAHGESLVAGAVTSAVLAGALGHADAAIRELEQEGAKLAACEAQLAALKARADELSVGLAAAGVAAAELEGLRLNFASEAERHASELLAAQLRIDEASAERDALFARTVELAEEERRLSGDLEEERDRSRAAEERAAMAEGDLRRATAKAADLEAQAAKARAGASQAEARAAALAAEAEVLRAGKEELALTLESLQRENEDASAFQQARLAEMKARCDALLGELGSARAEAQAQAAAELAAARGEHAAAQAEVRRLHARLEAVHGQLVVVPQLEERVAVLKAEVEASHAGLEAARDEAQARDERERELQLQLELAASDKQQLLGQMELLLDTCEGPEGFKQIVDKAQGAERELARLRIQVEADREDKQRLAVEAAKLRTFFSDFKKKSEVKIKTLQCNLGKAEEEVDDLEAFIEMARETLSKNHTSLNDDLKRLLSDLSARGDE
jgi:chromosome segregation ATPase